MAFKSIVTYNEERFGNLFRLPNDNDTADVIFLYRSEADVLVVDAHYLKSSEYSGYVQCTGVGCPLCSNNLRVQTKMFIPLYNVTTGKVEFWDRNITFENTFRTLVLKKYPNPCDYVFRITRHGVARSMDTTYDIVAVANNTVKTFDQIMSENNFTFPDFYNIICRDYSATELSRMLSCRNETGVANDYSAVARPSFEEVAGDGLPYGTADYGVKMDTEQPDTSKFSKFSNDAEDVEESDDDSTISFN